MKFLLSWVVIGITTLLMHGCNFNPRTPLTNGEKIRQGILDYLEAIRANQRELSGTEKNVKRILATDQRIKDLKAANIRQDEQMVGIDIWQVNTMTGRVYVLLESRDRTSHYTFTGSIVPTISGVRILIEESAHGISRKGREEKVAESPFK